MNFRVRRLTALILVLCLAIGISACKKTSESKDNQSLKSQNEQTTQSDEITEITIELNDNEVLGESFEVSEDELVEEYYQDKVVSYLSPYVPVYPDMNEDNTDANKVGLMLPKSIATIVEVYDEYTKIQSGNVEGYIKNESVLFGKEAEVMAKKYGSKELTPKAQELQVRKVAYEGSSILTTVTASSTLKYISEYKEWTLVQTDAGYGYVLTEEVDIKYVLKSAMTADEYQAYLDAEAVRIAAELERQRKVMRETAVKAAIAKYGQGNTLSNYSYDEIWLLACIIKYESGWEPYEGKLAVANVVLNRVKHAQFPSSIKTVVYQRNQFSGVSDGYGGPSWYFSSNFYNVPMSAGAYNYASLVHPEECMRAAIEALLGINNIGNRLYFMSSSAAAKHNLTSYGKDIHVIGNHWFYNR
ncbi:MAG: cell wall hydrolase [Lachnospira sp.]|nr:cell wall hydrolase [Lachnospira sp.]